MIISNQCGFIFNKIMKSGNLFSAKIFSFYINLIYREKRNDENNINMQIPFCIEIYKI